MFKPCETVKIQSDDPEHVGGFIVINAEDFKDGVHKLFVETVAVVRTAADWTVAELKAALTDLGAAFDQKATKPELQAIHAAAVAEKAAKEAAPPVTPQASGWGAPPPPPLSDTGGNA